MYSIIKLRLQINYSKKIHSIHINIMSELEQIFHKYNYNPKIKKHKKHFPASLNILYEDAIKNKQNLSISLSSKKIENQIIEIFNTIKRRYNMSTLFNNETGISHIYNNLMNANIMTIFDIKDDLKKYNKSDIIKFFPEFYDIKENRTHFDVIYKIKTENFISYANITDKTFSNEILICCNNDKKIYNIMFKSNPILSYDQYEYIIKYIYDNIEI